ncbi:SUF system NifU family Fe-S cluster assembly protein [Gammaproteobacteria bacterium]|nr:SUF system NifU family Fe-S cluster assembly protein [Gammaproteobacteria bacterium]
MSELRELYQELIIDHGRNPRNFGVLPNSMHQKDGYNPLCGDKVSLYINLKKNMINEIVFNGSGCAICMASASLMTEALSGKPVAYAKDLFESFRTLITGEYCSESLKEKLGKLTVLSGVCEFPARVKCASLAWHTLKAILINDDSIISTE